MNPYTKNEPLLFVSILKIDTHHILREKNVGINKNQAKLNGDYRMISHLIPPYSEYYINIKFFIIFFFYLPFSFFLFGCLFLNKIEIHQILTQMKMAFRT